VDEPWWESAYRKAPDGPFGGPGSEVEALAGSLPIGSRVLDAGCGSGRNALFLAQRGMHVEAFDVSTAALRRLEAEASARDIAVTAFRQDLRTFSARPVYDLVICYGVLHFLSKSASREAIRALRRATAPGGFNLIGVLTDSEPLPDHLRPHVRGRFREGELGWLYRHWEILSSSQYVLPDPHDSRGGRNAINKLLARKPIPVASGPGGAAPQRSG
jgi:tellurite methyltransferase